jgi:hypothetical protein
MACAVQSRSERSSFEWHLTEFGLTAQAMGPRHYASGFKSPSMVGMSSETVG